MSLAMGVCMHAKKHIALFGSLHFLGLSLLSFVVIWWFWSMNRDVSMAAYLAFSPPLVVLGVWPVFSRDVGGLCLFNQGDGSARRLHVLWSIHSTKGKERATKAHRINIEADSWSPFHFFNLFGFLPKWFNLLWVLPTVSLWLNTSQNNLRCLFKCSSVFFHFFKQLDPLVTPVCTFTRCWAKHMLA